MRRTDVPTNEHVQLVNEMYRLVKELLRVSEINYAHRIKNFCSRGSQRCGRCADMVCSDNMIKHDLARVVGRIKVLNGGR